MAKVKTSFFCQNCGVQSVKWIGKCPSCNEWNTYVEEVIEKEKPQNGVSVSKKQVSSKPQAINEISYTEENRLLIADKELNRVLGGGLVGVWG